MSVYNSLFFRVVVRRTAGGPAPFQWEIFKDGSVVPLQISPERYVSMEAAHAAGQAILTAMLEQKQKRPAGKQFQPGLRSAPAASRAASAAL